MLCCKVCLAIETVTFVAHYNMISLVREKNRGHVSIFLINTPSFKNGDYDVIHECL